MRALVCSVLFALLCIPVACGDDEPSGDVCEPGSTQTCVGPGACEGGQVCKDDGSGYGECDCGVGSGGNDGGNDSGGAGGGDGGAGMGGGGSGGAPPCVTCSAVLSNTADESQLCPTSQTIWDALTSCACVQSCSSQCATAPICGGNLQESGCAPCISTNCDSQLTACYDDV